MGAPMKPELMRQLCDVRDFPALTSCVLEMCEPFGAVHSFRFTHNRGTARVACVIELESAGQQQALARALGAAKGQDGSVCLEIPVGRNFGSARQPLSAGGARRAVACSPLAYAPPSLRAYVGI